MEEHDQHPQLPSNRDPRPSDAEVFLDMVKHMVSAYGQRSTDSRTACAAGIGLARETVGQLVLMGLVRGGTILADNQPLCQTPNNSRPNNVAPALPNGGTQGVMVAQFPKGSQPTRGL